ncbi:MAG: carbon monoxide dehydrogenase subunit G [Candidatus Aramenus sulfurataquae]|uniref:Carbon monoxide dehydrogenase subunit G n=1 Tax=Candidatus Aramenus sulfurataquae TaxID=1326980 RepID=W7KUH1_9CREN|nr:MAG: carbon monoxide dehydrogenase subunit G [Candidatus Aramenus sulfurataquae]
MSEVMGTRKIKDKDKVLEALSDKKTLLGCTPGVKEIDGDKFTAQVKVGLLNVEVEGILKDFKVNGNEVSNLLEVTGPGIIVAISTSVKVYDDYLEWKASYDVTGPLARAISNTIDRKAKEIATEIIECTLSSADVGDDS